MDLEELDEAARRQHGLVSWSELLEHVSRATASRWCREGRMERVAAGVYRLAGAPVSFEQVVLARVLWCGPGSAASHETAARLHGLRPGWRTQAPEVTVPLGRKRRGSGVIIRRSELTDNDVVTVSGIPVTTVARTLVDLSACCSEKRIEVALDDALAKRLVTLDEVVATYLRLRRPGRPRLSRIRKVIERRVDLKATSALERKVAIALRDCNLPEPVGQWQVLGRSHLWTLDFAWPEHKIAVEVQSFAFHADRQSLDDDARKAYELAGEGWLVIPVTDRSDMSVVASTVRRRLKRPA